MGMSSTIAQAFAIFVAKFAEIWIGSSEQSAFEAEHPSEWRRPERLELADLSKKHCQSRR